jgi:AcrR family transcriptional regulator
MAERPIDAIAIDDIVRAAGVAKGSFFNHFDDKEAFAGAVASQVRGEIEDAVAQLNAGIDDPASRVARAVCLYVRSALRDPRRAGVLLRGSPQTSHMTTPLNRGVVADISQGLLAGRFAVPTAEAGVLMVIGAAQVVVGRVIGEPSPSVAAAVTQQLCSLLLRGLGLSAGDADGIAARAAHEVLGPTGAASP